MLASNPSEVTKEFLCNDGKHLVSGCIKYISDCSQSTCSNKKFFALLHVFVEKAIKVKTGACQCNS